MKTNKTILILLLSATCMLLATDSAQAARRWRRSRGIRTTRQVTPQPTERNDVPYQVYRRYEWVYPRYIGAFHYRDLQNLGVPTGDRGFRGTPW
jgi:hypothetical protein